MSNRTNRNTLLTMSVFLLVMAGTTFAGPLLFPIHVGLRCEYKRWDSNDPVNEWPVQWEIKSQVTIDSLDYFQLDIWNYDNDSAHEDEGYFRSTEQALYGYNPDGDDYLEFQMAPVGTKWSFYQEHGGLDYKFIEIVAIEQVTVPYGTFNEAYNHRRYRCENSDGSGDRSPDWYEWVVPGVGMVKEVDYWAMEELGQIPPLTMELVDIIIAADIDIHPNTLNLKSEGKWITCSIWFPEGFDVDDTKSVLLNGEVTPGWYMVHETRQMLKVKFKRSKVQDILNVGQVELTISGELIDGTKFEGTDTITVIDKGNKK